ncbi:MAG TPA: TRAP transporter small permease [Geminicoccaceae bacterium]|nr:TRAP transporter small permease [Geminicoccaceae bacterium]
MTDRADAGGSRRLLAHLARINGRIERALAYLAGLCLAAFTLVILVDVIYRQVLARPLLWPSEWSVMIFVWSVMLGAAVSARRRAHFVVELLPDPPPAVDFVLRVLVALAGLVFAFVLVWFGYQMTLTGLRRLTPMMGYPLVYVFAAFPFAGLAIALFTVEQIIEVLTGRDRTRDEGREGAAE